MGWGYLEAEDLRLNEGEGLAVDLDETLALLFGVSFVLPFLIMLDVVKSGIRRVRAGSDFWRISAVVTRKHSSQYLCSS